MNWNLNSVPPALQQWIIANTGNPGSATPNGIFAPMPGQKQGLTIEQIQTIINSSKRVKGFSTTLVAANNATPVPLNLSGSANWLLGFTVFPRTSYANPSQTPTSVSLMLNDEQVMQPTPFNLLDKRYIQGEYFVFPRPLSGNDDFTITYDNTTGGNQTVELAVYYL